MLSRAADAECPDLRVWPTADVLAIFHFHADDEVDFDVDLGELQGQGSGLSNERGFEDRTTRPARQVKAS
ncbi:hypothetical protein [Streptomyces sp. NPDC002952]|uniref:hypothetical protein n=1 Tax=Streptomyces sp. NPDC002952 TaxID=3364673 RepID=UPI003693E743